MKKKSGIAVSTTLVAASMALSGCSETSRAQGADSLPTRTAHLSYAIDVTDQATLAGFSDRVFVGKVVKKTGDRSVSGDTPAGQFEVEVKKTLKGPQMARQVVSQEGGVKDGQVVLMEGDQLLEPGKAYLFAGRYDSGTGSVIIVPKFGDVRVVGEEDGAVLKMRASIQHEKAVKVG